MSQSTFPLSAATPAELDYLSGKIVLVRSARDYRNPPSAMRGTLEVRDSDRGPVVQIALEFPQMFTTRAHHRTITLDDMAVERLLESEHEGTFGLTIDEPLDPCAPSGSE
ncbi:MAG: hypothetical protein Q7S40_26075 [Opitutaceae bacterium]|nr:hypothetical protein [Opitutaceae bacterium]